MAVHFGVHTYFTADSHTDRRNGYLIATDSCGRSIELPLRTRQSAQLPIDRLQDMLTEMRQLVAASYEFGDSSAWTDETELECLRILGRASALAARAATRVEAGGVAGASAAIMANDPSVAVTASVCAVSLSRSRSRERNDVPTSPPSTTPPIAPRRMGDRIQAPPLVQISEPGTDLSGTRSRSRERHD